MLEDIMNMYCEKHDNDEEIIIDNEEIKELENKYSELLDRIKELDKKLGNETDDLIGNMIVTYRSLFFDKGFKYGLILAQEIQQLLLTNC